MTSSSDQNSKPQLNHSESRDSPELDIHEANTLEGIFESIGSYGRWQRLILWLIVFPACVPCGLHMLSQLFMTEIPPHHCKLPDRVNDLMRDYGSSIHAVLPQQGNGEPARCQEFNVTDEDLEDTVRGLLKHNQSWPVMSCQRGWSYNVSALGVDVGPTSIVDEFDLVCDKDFYPSLVLSIFNVGSVIGVAAFGYISDRYGRKKAFFSCLLLETIGAFATGLSPNFGTFIFTRFLVGLTIPAIWQLPFILALEFVGAAHRGFVTILTCTWYTGGLLLLTGLAYVFPYWKHVAFATAVPLLPLFLAYKYLPESPRWNLRKGRIKETLETMETIARVNGTPMNEATRERVEMLLRKEAEQEEVQKSTQKHSKAPTVLDLFRTPNMRRKTLLINLSWFANQTVYMGLNYCGPAMGNNSYVGFSLSSAVELICYPPTYLAMDKIGRRLPMAIAMIIGGISAICTVVMPSDEPTPTMILFLISKLSITASFLIIYPFAGELYPTELRSIGLSLDSYVSNLGLIAVPFIVYLGVENLVLPLIIMGVISTVGGVFSLLLPETLNKPLPQTLEEAEEFGKGWGWRSVLRGEKKAKEEMPECKTQSMDLDALA